MRRFSFWGGLLGAIFGALLGAMDQEIVGGIVGGLFGGFVGLLFGNAIDLVAALLLLNGEVIGPPGTFKFLRIWRWAVRLIGLIVLVVFVHELYWAINFLALTGTHNLGARITQAVGRGDSPQAIKDMLVLHRWQVATVNVRPVRWCLRGDVQAATLAATELVDFVNGKGIDRDRKDAELSRVREKLSPNWLPDEVAGPQLNAIGKGLAELTEEEIDRYIPRTWLLRYLPRSILIPKE